MNYNTEILSLWVGPQSQQEAHHFYSLQSEQFFEDSQDPTNHQSLWNINPKTTQKFTKMMIFDTKSNNLTRIRQVNHSKMIKKMKQTSTEQSYFNFIPSQKEEEILDEQQNTLFEGWSAKEENYVLIDKKMNQEGIGFDFWSGIYRLQQDKYEDRIRRRLQGLDYLHVLSLCTDGQRLGFTQQILIHLLDQCPKKTILFTNLSNSNNEHHLSQISLPLLSDISPQVSILLDIDTNPIQYQYFNSNFYHHFSPLFNCFLTPFTIKNSSTTDYINQISSGRRTLFDLAYTLPIISEENQLSKETNIFDYLPNKKVLNQTEEYKINHVNYANRSFLNVFQHTQEGKTLLAMNEKKMKVGGIQKIAFNSQKILSQAYVLKGHFNQVGKLCHQRSQHFDIKYLQGIFSANPLHQLTYSEFYRKDYGEKVEAYPLHSVLYQHCAFGPSIRNYLRTSRSKQSKHESFNQWKEGAINLADLYAQEIDNDSD